ncbi:MAG: histone deacetylase [Chloroflexi bacterium]|nr:histone deacetylase [Chloroflexota bacterium]
MSLGYMFDPVCLKHDTGDHPESAQRLIGLMEHLKGSGLLAEMCPLPPEAATLRDLARVHSPAMIDRVRNLAESGGGYIDLDTVVSADSYEAAARAAGGTISATRAVLTGAVTMAFVFVRPPGHHATRERSMGFCLFNNVAVAAAWALEQGGVSRVAIVDYDVHHGNGTQDIVGGDARVLYISTHQYPYYPGTGHWRETGVGEGEGTCINVPLPPNTGDKGFAQIYERIVVPALERFGPELILISSGFDGHWADPLAWMLLSVEGYRRVASLLQYAAQRLCAGRAVFVLEGGYHLQALAHSVAGTVSELLGRPYQDPLGPAREPEVDVQGIIRRVARFHRLDE